MKSQSKSGRANRSAGSGGFSLIELMVVLIIIAVFAAIAGPSLVEVHRRNKLTDLLNLVERSASQVRNLAMQTRRGAVLEMGEGRMWINTLKGSDCWSAINVRCTHNLGQAASDSQSRYVELTADEFVESEAFMCGVDVATMTGGSCALDIELAPTDSFGLCYSGRGDLYLRIGGDGATLCDGSGDPAPQDNWVRSCMVNPASADPFNGAVLYFNRYEDGAPSSCAVPAKDVMRAVYMPAGASPYSRVEI